MAIKPGQGLRYSVNSYRMKVRNTRLPTLLVEGRRDKQAFDQLFDHAKAKGHQARKGKPVVDTAEALIESSIAGFGNRQRVEAVARGWNGCPSEFTAFIDREMDGFNLAIGEDSVNEHRCDGPLIWSRGHSLENYLFDIETFVSAVRAIALTDSFESATGLFADNYQEIMRIACAIGSAATAVSRQKQVVKTLRPNHIHIVDGRIRFLVEEWREALVQTLRGDEEIVDELINTYDQHFTVLSNSPTELARWGCHGHLGLRMLWLAYSQCVFYVSGDRSEAQRIIEESKEEIRQSLMCDIWARRAVSSEVEYPRLVLLRLGVIGAGG